MLAGVSYFLCPFCCLNSCVFSHVQSKNAGKARRIRLQFENARSCGSLYPVLYDRVKLKGFEEEIFHVLDFSYLQSESIFFLFVHQLFDIMVLPQPTEPVHPVVCLI